eukprot:GHVU01078383.1.p2 GENE.GHVU01078383.1~~GHVU01078383.1.p2  ORF type:complete len:125 (-),score=1.20 GHVU01078383.1:786-1160(-)
MNEDHGGAMGPNMWVAYVSMKRMRENHRKEGPLPSVELVVANSPTHPPTNAIRPILCRWTCRYIDRDAVTDIDSPSGRQTGPVNTSVDIDGHSTDHNTNCTIFTSFTHMHSRDSWACTCACRDD